MLGAVLLDNRCLDECRDVVEPEDFFEDRHQRLWRVFLALVDQGSPVDLVTACSLLESVGSLRRVGGSAYLAELMHLTPSVTSARYYAGIVAEKSKLRRLIDACETSIQQAVSGSEDADAVIAAAEQRVIDVEPLNTSRLADQESAGQELWTFLNSPTPPGVATGFRRLDEALIYLQPGAVYVIAARPAVGKSTMALNIAYNAAYRTQKRTVFFSLEMSKLELQQKLVGIHADINPSLLRQPNLIRETGGLPVVRRALDELRSAPLWFDETPGIDVATAASRLRKMKVSTGIDLIVIDYLQLMEGPGREEYDVVTANSQRIKKLARQMSVPIILLSQLSRESERRADHTPTLADLRASGAIEQDADVVSFLYRPGMYSREHDPTETRFILAKNRHGESGVTIGFAFEPTTGRFSIPGTEAPVW